MTSTATRALSVKDERRAGHISMLDSDTLSIALLAFVSAEPIDAQEQIKKLATLRLVTKGWAAFFARRLYDKTATLVYTSRMTQGADVDTPTTSRNDAINSACALSMDSMGYLMYSQISPYLSPVVCFATLRLLMQFADADYAERLRLLGMGMGLSEAQVAHVASSSFDTNQVATGDQPEAQA